MLLVEEEGDIIPQVRVYIEGVQLIVLVDLVAVLLVIMMQELQIHLHQHHHLFQLLHQDKEILVVLHTNGNTAVEAVSFMCWWKPR